MLVTIQTRNVPEEPHRRLMTRTAASGQSRSDYLLGQMHGAGECPTLDELHERIRSRGGVIPSNSPADVVRAERDSR